MSTTRGWAEPFRICFVCSGNICRSPMAEVVLRAIAENAGVGDSLEISSASTGDWHVGERADARARRALRLRGYDGDAHRARQFEASDLDRFDLVVALDRSHERILHSWAGGTERRAAVRLLLGFDRVQAEQADVPDPFYSDDAMFDRVLDMIERADHALFAQLEPAMRRWGA